MKKSNFLLKPVNGSFLIFKQTLFKGSNVHKIPIVSFPLFSVYSSSNTKLFVDKKKRNLKWQS